MTYKKIYDDLVGKRKQYPISKDQEGHWHHIVPRSLGGKEVLRFTIREHIFLHELLVRIYRDEIPNTEAYEKMVRALDMMYKTYPQYYRHTHSKSVSRIMAEDLRIRKTKTRISNERLGKCLWWDMGKPLTEEMIRDGWHLGRLENEDIKRKIHKIRIDRKWIHKKGYPDRFVKQKEYETLLSQGWKIGRTNLPKDFKLKASLRLKDNEIYRGNMKDRLWIYNPKTNECGTIRKNDSIPEGWMKGRNGKEQRLERLKDIYSPLYEKYKSLHYNYQKLKENNDFLSNMSHKLFLSNCSSYAENFETKLQRVKNLTLYYFETYQKFGYEKVVKECGYKGTNHSLFALFRHYNLKYVSNNTKRDNLYLDYYDVYTKKGYDYLYKTYGCKVPLKNLTAFWKRRNLKFVTYYEKFEKKDRRIFEMWKNYGFEKIAKVFKKENTKRFRLKWTTIFNKRFKEEYQQEVKRKKEEEYEKRKIQYENYAKIYNTYGFEYLKEKTGYPHVISCLLTNFRTYGIPYKNPDPHKRVYKPRSKEVKEKIAKALRGNKWMTNGSKTIQAKPNEIEKYKLQGYVLGRKFSAKLQHNPKELSS